MKHFVIRKAVDSDAAAIAEIYNEAITSTTVTFDTEPQSVQDRLEWLQSHENLLPVIVAECNNQIAGWAALTKWSDRPAYKQTAESSFYVAEKFRGKGIGRALKTRLIDESREFDVHTIIARVVEGNTTSIHLNESVGFQMVGTMKEVGLKFEKRLDVHLMQLILDDSADL